MSEALRRLGLPDSISDAEIGVVLDEVRTVGPLKPMGYVPLITLTELCMRGVDEFAEELRDEGKLTYLAPDEERCIVKTGALYAWDEIALSGLLTANRTILGSNGWPVRHRDFVKRVSYARARPFTDLYNVVADAFGDKTDKKRKIR